MAANWWEIQSDKWSAEQAQAAQSAYYYTLLSTAYGRQVMAHLRLTAQTRNTPADGDASDNALATLTAIDFVEWIRMQCGPVDELRRLRTEARTAAKGLGVTAEPQNELEGFKDD